MSLQSEWLRAEPERCVTRRARSRPAMPGIGRRLLEKWSEGWTVAVALLGRNPDYLSGPTPWSTERPASRAEGGAREREARYG